MGNWIQLRSGGGYDFDEARIFGPFTMEDDLAKPLSIPRYAMHASVPWPVNNHSVAVARTIETITGDLDAAGGGVLHDAHEAVIGDIPTPVAWAIDYEKIKELKREVQSAIHWALRVPERCYPDNHKKFVDKADQAALHVERRLWMVPEPREWNVPVPEQEWMLVMHRMVKRIAFEPIFASKYDRPLNQEQLFEAEYYRLILQQEHPVYGTVPAFK